MASKLNKNLNNLMRVINDIDKNETIIINEKNAINERATYTEDANLSYNMNNVI